MGFGKNGLQLGLATRMDVTPQQLQAKSKTAAESIKQIAAGVKGGEYTSASQAWEACATVLETIYSDFTSK
jgi:hypothetical protein